VRALLAGDGGVLKIARRIWEVGVAGWPSTGSVFNITAAAWTVRASTGGVLGT